MLRIFQRFGKAIFTANDPGSDSVGVSRWRDRSLGPLNIVYVPSPSVTVTVVLKLPV
jgi:hypothetical protein